MYEATLQIENMHCGSCVQRVTKTLNSIAGVHAKEVTVGMARVEILDGAVNPATLVEAVTKAGYPAKLSQ